MKYPVGTRIGPKNLLLLSYSKKDSNGHWYGIFDCPYCHNPFEAAITSVVSGCYRGCGCFLSKVKYHQGDTVGPFQLLMVSNPWRENKRTKAYFKCPYCNETFIARVDSVVSGNTVSCKCQRKIRGKQQGENSFIDITNQRFGKLVAQYPVKHNGYRDSYLCLCDCGRTKIVRTKNLKRGLTTSCGYCTISKGEEKIAFCLKLLNLNFSQQKTFSDCKNPNTGYLLRFDFYLPDYNCCIEYDGQQHYTGWYNDKESLTENQYRDFIKNQYCKDNNIKLIRIPYWDYDKIDKNYLQSLIR